MITIHDRCEKPATAPDGAPLECMKSAGHTDAYHADRSEGYVWRTGETPVREEWL